MVHPLAEEPCHSVRVSQTSVSVLPQSHQRAGSSQELPEMFVWMHNSMLFTQRRRPSKTVDCEPGIWEEKMYVPNALNAQLTTDQSAPLGGRPREGIQTDSIRDEEVSRLSDEPSLCQRHTHSRTEEDTKNDINYTTKTKSPQRPQIRITDTRNNNQNWLLWVNQN